MRARLAWALAALLLWLGAVCLAGAEEGSTAAEDAAAYFFDRLELDELDESLADLLGEKSPTFSESVWAMVKGEQPFSWQSVAGLIKDAVLGDFAVQRALCVQLLLLLIASAVFANFSRVFEKNQVSAVSFYLLYLLLFSLLMKVFLEMSAVALEAVDGILRFVRVLLPAYLMCVFLSSGTITAMGFYELTLVVIAGAQWLLEHFLVPGVTLYVTLVLLNQLMPEDYLTKLADLIKLVIVWVTRTGLALVLGIQTVQCLVTPAVDSLKRSVVTKGAAAIPGIGNTMDAVTEVVLGAAVVIKNAVGAVGLIALVIICLIPLAKLGACVLLYRLLGAAAQPVSDKRMLSGVEGVAEGAALLLRILFASGVLFFVMLAMITASIRGG